MNLRVALPPSVLMGGIGLLFVGAVATVFVVQGPHRVSTTPEWTPPEGDPQQGQAAIVQHGCGACHSIPGIRGANARVGPRLDGIVEQSYIAGMLSNTPENLAQWIQQPQEINPGTAMPDLGVTEKEAQDIAAYLYTMDRE